MAPCKTPKREGDGCLAQQEPWARIAQAAIDDALPMRLPRLQQALRLHRRCAPRPRACRRAVFSLCLAALPPKCPLSLCLRARPAARARGFGRSEPALWSLPCLLLAPGRLQADRRLRQSPNANCTYLPPPSSSSLFFSSCLSVADLVVSCCASPVLHRVPARPSFLQVCASTRGRRT